ncbi:MFS transporter [Paracrocinitomix mangrovi]|uniref:MFS transporter n=1 Tax=Paracrocinitomix mangrovi TaxID=2862509 RepID=UPI001C8DBB2B|nr:MFS transporter [Paracrocinitomix mangrovi]UKN02044.1 MFS transporter [Paracrocinitomix mangrovi]
MIHKKLLPAYLLTFVNVLGFSILMPVLPFIVEDYGAQEWVYGLFMTLYSAFQFFGAPYLGAMSDSRGRKPVLIISQAGTLLSWIVFIIALTLPNVSIWGLSIPLLIIGVSRIFDGLTGGNTSVAFAYVSDITSREEKIYIFSYLGGISAIGMIVGPGLGGIAASGSLGSMGAIILAAGISVITLITLFFWIKESHPEEKRRPRERKPIIYNIFILRRIREIQPKPIIKLIFILKLLVSMMMAFYLSTIALFLIDLFEFTKVQLGQFMLVVGVFLFFNQVVISKWVIRKIGAGKTLILGLIFSTFGLFFITLTDNIYAYIAFYYIMNLGISLCFPTINSLISIHADPQKQGEIMGISESLNSLALAIFPVLGATLYMYYGSHIYWAIAALPFIGLIVGLTNRKVFQEA